MHPLSCFINNHYGFWKLTFGHQVKVTQKVRKSVYNIKRCFKQFFTFLERTSTFIIALFRAIYGSSYPDVFIKKAFCYRYVAYFQRNTHAELLHGCSPVNCLNIRRTPFLKNTSGWLLLYIWKWIQHVPTSIHLFRVEIEKLQSTKLTIKVPEQQS